MRPRDFTHSRPECTNRLDRTQGANSLFSESGNHVIAPSVPSITVLRKRHYSLAFKCVVRKAMETSSTRFEDCVSLMTKTLGRADRVKLFRGYRKGLMLPVQRKSVEPMVAHLSPD